MRRKRSAACLAGYDWLQMAIGLVFALAIVWLASLYRRRQVKG